MFQFHQDLESYRILEGAQIEACSLLHLVQAVYQCIPVNIQLPRGLRHVQILPEEHLDRVHHFFVEQCFVLRREQALIIAPAGSGIRLQQKALQTEPVEGKDILFPLEAASNLDGLQCFSITAAELCQVSKPGTDAHIQLSGSIHDQGVPQR